MVGPADTGTRARVARDIWSIPWARKRRGAERSFSDLQKTLQKKGRRVAKKGDRESDTLAGLLGGAAATAAPFVLKAGTSAARRGAGAAGLLATAVAALQNTDGLAPQVQERVEQAARFAQDRREEYAPKAAARLADAAGRAEKAAHDVTVPTSVEQLLVTLTGDKDVVKNLRKNAEGYAHQAKKDLKRRARAEKRSSGRGWILAGMAVAAAGAGYAVWTLTKPVKDPWTAPIPGPITANIPVVQTEGSANPYAKQQQAVAEANAKLLGTAGTTGTAGATGTTGAAQTGRPAVVETRVIQPEEPKTEVVDVRPTVAGADERRDGQAPRA